MNDRKCPRCGLMSMENLEGQKIPVQFSEISFYEETIGVCFLCLNEIRAINSRSFDMGLKSKKIN